MSATQNANPQAGQGIPLPKKETDLFRAVVKHYESKQYKKGTKAADTILKKYPKHGETLCMKGLILNCQGKKFRDEAISMVKLGLMNDMRSHVCWHVYGLIYRSERNYNEAIKAYKQALRIDKQNHQILKDLALLQIQMRDLEGFTKSQHAILDLKPSLKGNWLAFALGKHMSEDHRGAIDVIDIFLGTLEEGSTEFQRNYETSELVMYKNSILSEIDAGANIKEALDHLEESKDLIVDELARLKMKGLYQLQLKEYSAAKTTFMSLLSRGSTEDYSVHTGYMCAALEMDVDICTKVLKRKGNGARTLASLEILNDSQRSVLKIEYQGTLQETFAKSFAIKRIIIELLAVDFKCNSSDSTAMEECTEALKAYLQANIRRGVPSLGQDLSALFLVECRVNKGEYIVAKDPVDIKAHPVYQQIVLLVEQHITSLSEQNSTFPDSDVTEPPSTLLWTWYLRAILHEVVAEYKEGIEMADTCIEQTPTGVDLYELKGRLVKGAGDIHAAVDCLEKGRDLDKQDRYICNQTTKYLLQANDEVKALERMALFTRHESDPEQNIYDMQVTWYELELAACFRRKMMFGKSLKKYMAIEKHFEDFHEDQFDFHSYCIRKVTLRAYVDVLRWEDVLWGHETYAEAAEGIIRTYLHLHDNPAKSDFEAEPDYASMTPAERKKAKAIARKKRKKAEKKLEQDAAKAKEESNKSSKDEDPAGLDLLNKNPLEEAKTYANSLVKNAQHSIQTWLCQYDVCVRRGKSTMALQALWKAKELDKGGENTEILRRVVDFCKNVECQSTNETVKKTFANETNALLGGKSLNEFLEGWIKRISADSKTDLALRLEIGKSMVSCDVGSVKEVVKVVVGEGLELRGVALDVCKEALDFLTSLGADAKEGADDFKGAVMSRYCLASL